ncbi:MAG: hypothetical protein AAF684_05835 [Pseudomonadota bacterium]
MGDVFVSRAGLRTAIGRGKRVFMGEKLRSRSADGRLAVRMVDGALLVLGGGTDFQLNRYIYEPDFGAGEAALQMFAGVARYRSGVLAADGGSILIATPLGDVTASGDDFWMRVDEEQLELGVFENGDLTVATAAGSVNLQGPYRFTVVWSFAEPPEPPLPLSRAAIGDLRASLAFDEPGVGLAAADAADPDADPPLGPETPGPERFDVVAAVSEPPAAFWRAPPDPEEALDEAVEDAPAAILDAPPLEDAVDLGPIELDEIPFEDVDREPVEPETAPIDEAPPLKDAVDLGPIELDEIPFDDVDRELVDPDTAPVDEAAPITLEEAPLDAAPPPLEPTPGPVVSDDFAPPPLDQTPAAAPAPIFAEDGPPPLLIDEPVTAPLADEAPEPPADAPPPPLRLSEDEDAATDGGIFDDAASVVDERPRFERDLVDLGPPPPRFDAPPALNAPPPTRRRPPPAAATTAPEDGPVSADHLDSFFRGL